MEPGTQEKDLQSVLGRLDEGLTKLVGGKDELDARLKVLEGQFQPLEARFKVYDDTLESHDKWKQDIERKFTAARFDADGHDHIRAAMPDNVKQLIPRLSSSGGYQRVRKLMGTSAPDPVSYTEMAWWFYATMRQRVFGLKGESRKADSWGEQAAKSAERLGGVDPVIRVALQEDTASEGGEMVPTIIEAMIGVLLLDSSIVRQSGPSILQMTTLTHKLPRLDNDFTVSIDGEEVTIGDSTPANPLGSVTLTAKKWDGLATISLELIEDSVVNLMDFVIGRLTEVLGRTEDAQLLEGDGTKFTGLFSAAGLNSKAGGSNALSFDELQALIYGGEHQSTIDGGVIYSHPWILRDAIGLTTGTAGMQWLPFTMTGQPILRNILGVACFPTSVISRTRGGGTNETTVYHGNPRYLVIGERSGLRFDINPWAGDEFKKGQVLLRMIRRQGLAVWVPKYFTKLTAVTVAA